MSEIFIPKSNNALNSHENIKKICSPIFKLLGLTFFRYLRVYKDLSRVHLCTHPEWTDNFYSKGLYNIAWLDVSRSLFEKNMEFIWDIKAATDDNIVGVEARDNFRLYHGISLVRTSMNYHEIYDFATCSENIKINEIYMNHLELFERFILYFKDQAKDLILDGSKSRIIFKPSETDLVYTGQEKNDFGAEVLDEFFNETKIKKLHVDSYYGETYLTLMEIKCVYWTLMGKNAEEVGIILGTVKRTVETHIDNIKKKLGISKITQISSVISLDTINHILKK